MFLLLNVISFDHAFLQCILKRCRSKLSMKSFIPLPLFYPEVSGGVRGIRHCLLKLLFFLSQSPNPLIQGGGGNRCFYFQMCSLVTMLFYNVF
jgi:hypothetical protein